jgi:hypothetical protein
MLLDVSFGVWLALKVNARYENEEKRYALRCAERKKGRSGDR